VISIGVGGIAGDSAVVDYQEFADRPGAVCAHHGRAGRSFFVTDLSTISVHKMNEKE
jgi:hypothetical protein